MPRHGYEFFDHTADIGIRAEGATLADVFIGMAQGLTALLIEDSRIDARQERTVRLQAEDETALLHAWLADLLFRFSTERFAAVECILPDVTPTRLRGTVRGGCFDPSRHVQGREVKAITRHQLQVRRQDGGWRAQAIVDI